MKYLKGHIIKELCLSDSIGIKETTLLNGYEITDIISKITIRVGGEFTHKAIYLPRSIIIYLQRTIKEY